MSLCSEHCLGSGDMMVNKTEEVPNLRAWVAYTATGNTTLDRVSTIFKSFCLGVFVMQLILTATLINQCIVI